MKNAICKEQFFRELIFSPQEDDVANFGSTFDDPIECERCGKSLYPESDGCWDYQGLPYCSLFCAFGSYTMDMFNKFKE